MKYVVNRRGRAIESEDEMGQRLISQGFVEITKQQFAERTYFPEFDKGSAHPLPPTSYKEVHKAKREEKERTVFHTTVV